MEEPYTNRELDAKFEAILSKQDEYFEAHTKVLVDIKEQTTKTNGSVALIKGSQKWQQGFMFAVGTMLMAIVVPALAYFAILAINNNAKLEAISALVQVLQK